MPQPSSNIPQPDQRSNAAASKVDDITTAEAENTTQLAPHAISPRTSTQTTPNTSSPTSPTTNEPPTTGLSIYIHYYLPITSTILKSLFFASIGFSIPISQMFAAHIVWRGLVYAILMTLGKLLCGICLIQFPFPSIPKLSFSSHTFKSNFLKRSWWADLGRTCLSFRPSKNENDNTSQNRPSGATSTPAAPTEQISSSAVPSATVVKSPSRPPPKKKSQTRKPPRSLYPAAILGTAMVARGEIGFLVSSIAQSNGIFSDASEGRAEEGESSDLFLVVTWAILICTVVGPVAVGLMVKRVRRLQEGERKGNRSGREDPLGVWGVLASK
jgi:hypothetical protein